MPRPEESMSGRGKYLPPGLGFCVEVSQHLEARRQPTS